MNKDLTVGAPAKVLSRFCLPLFGSVIFQQLYTLADSFVAGKFLGENALAAVGNSYEITLIFIAFAFGSSIGCSVIVSQLFGAKRLRDLKTAVSTAFLAVGALTLLLMALGLTFGGALLRRIHTPQEIFADSAVYLDIYLWGLPFLFFYNVSTGIFSGLGDSVTPFLFLAASSLANIGVDVLFVTTFAMGVKGVALATLLCQGVSCVLAVGVVMGKLGKMKTGERPALFSPKLFVRIAHIAVPSILQQSFVSVGNILLQSMINTFGSAVIAGYAAGVKLNNLVITSFTTLGNGVSNYTAQNLGAGKTDRLRSGLRAGLRLVWGLCVPFAALYLFFGGALTRFFLDAPSEAAVATGGIYLRILAPFYFVISAKLICDGVLRGLGRMRAFMAATFTDLVLRVGLARVFSAFFGATGIWAAWPVGWCLATVLSAVFTARALKGKKNGA